MCGEGTFDIRGECMPSGILAAIVSSVAFVIVAQLGYMYLRYRRAKNDEIWHVNTEELHFSQPVEVIGQGSFGVVLLAEYRGTKVAIKRVLPTKEDKRSRTGSKSGVRSTASVDVNGSTDEKSLDIESADDNATPPSDDHAITGSKTGSMTGSKLGSMTGTSGSMDSELDFLGHVSFGGPKTRWQKMFPWLNQDREMMYNASILGTASGSAGTSRTMMSRMCPWFDENHRRRQEFMVEMRLLSRLRHPCK